MNKGQKIVTIIYAVGLLIIFLALTPWYDYNADNGVNYGTFFLLAPKMIYYKSLYFEIGLWTALYLLSVLFLKSSKNKISK